LHEVVSEGIVIIDKQDHIRKSPVFLG
jgi:hypothetical protein